VSYSLINSTGENKEKSRMKHLLADFFDLLMSCSETKTFFEAKRPYVKQENRRRNRVLCSTFALRDLPNPS
jgi:hypothetical protein